MAHQWAHRLWNTELNPILIQHDLVSVGPWMYGSLFVTRRGLALVTSEKTRKTRRSIVLLFCKCYLRAAELNLSVDQTFQTVDETRQRSRTCSSGCVFDPRYGPVLRTKRCRVCENSQRYVWSGACLVAFSLEELAENSVKIHAGRASNILKYNELLFHYCVCSNPGGSRGAQIPGRRMMPRAPKSPKNVTST